MANKYSRYELTPFPSLYVDDRKIDISKLLSQRYDANKQSKDLIDRTLSQMELLDGDKAHGERVKQDVKTLLKDHITRGDWENSSLVIQDAAQAVETDQGLIWANKSMQNRQAEIQAIREAKLNGIPMLDFGAEDRKTHQSYYYDEESGTYITNVYEPMSQTKLDYRSRKENMIGKIPADQQGNLTYVGRGKTNKIANLLVEQYIADTKEGIQEYRKIVEIDLPQSIPLEERMRMAKNLIKKDFQEAAQQQEFNKVAATKGGDRNSGNGVLMDGITIKSSASSKVNTHFDDMNDKIRGIQEEQLGLLNHLSNPDVSEEDKKLYQKNFDNNQRLLTTNMKKVAKENGDKGLYALEKYENIEKRFSKYGEDGQRLLAATQYLTYNTTEGDTDWDLVSTRTLQGSIAGGTSMATYGAVGGTVVLPGAGTVVGAAGMGAVGAIGGGVGGFFAGVGESMFGDLRNIRDWQRPQEGGYYQHGFGITDNEREQLAEELWGDEDLDDASVKHINDILGTNFNESDKKELMSMTNSYYTFMTKDKFIDENGQKVDRLSGDQLFEKVAEKSFVINQPSIGFDMTDEGKKLRAATADYFRKDFDFNSAGIASDNMLPGSPNLSNWIEDGGGALKIQLENVRLADIRTNTPLRLTFGFEGDAEGKKSRDFYVTDQTVMQPGGWVYDLLDKNMGLGKNAYDELLRQQYDDIGYDNVKVGNYITDMSYKDFMYAGGGSEEDLANATSVMQDKVIMNILLNPTTDLPQYPLNGEGQRGTIGSNGQWIPFNNEDGSFNQAAWITLQSQPNKLAKLRANVLNMSMAEFTGYNF